MAFGFKTVGDMLHL